MLATARQACQLPRPQGASVPRLQASRPSRAGRAVASSHAPAQTAVLTHVPAATTTAKQSPTAPEPLLVGRRPWEAAGPSSSPTEFRIAENNLSPFNPNLLPCRPMRLWRVLWCASVGAMPNHRQRQCCCMASWAAGKLQTHTALLRSRAPLTPVDCLLLIACSPVTPAQAEHAGLCPAAGGWLPTLAGGVH